MLEARCDSAVTTALFLGCLCRPSCRAYCTHRVRALSVETGLPPPAIWICASLLGWLMHIIVRMDTTRVLGYLIASGFWLRELDAEEELSSLDRKPVQMECRSRRGASLQGLRRDGLSTASTQTATASSASDNNSAVKSSLCESADAAESSRMLETSLTDAWHMIDCPVPGFVHGKQNEHRASTALTPSWTEHARGIVVAGWTHACLQMSNTRNSSWVAGPLCSESEMLLRSRRSRKPDYCYPWKLRRQTATEHVVRRRVHSP